MDIHVSKIDFILPKSEQRSQIAFLTKNLAAAFEQLGCKIRILSPPQNKDPKPFLDDLFAHTPDCTLCFNGILPDQEGRFLSDLIRIPHFAILTESPNDFLPLAKSVYTTVLSPDQQQVDILNEGGCKRTFFFPLAASPSGVVPPLKQRKRAILMPLAESNGEAIRLMWEQNLPKKMVGFLDEVIVQSLKNPSLSYHHAFQMSFAQQSPADQQSFLPWISFAFFQQLEEVLRDRDVRELLTALKDLPLELVVEKPLKGIPSHFRIHEGLSPEETVQMMGEAQIVLTSSPQFKFGSSGDLYTALSMGAYTFHNQAEFLQQGYEQQRGVYFYPFAHPEAIKTKALEVVKNPSAFQDAVDRGRAQVLASETWLERAKLLLDFMSPIVQQLKATK